MPNRAAVMTGLQTIEIRDVGEPTLQPHQALVSVEAVGVCGSDTGYYKVGRIGDYVVTGPLVLGHDVAGLVVAVGARVTRFAVGDAVYGRVADGRIGTFAESISVAEADLAPKPSTLTMVEAAAVPLVALGATWPSKKSTDHCRLPFSANGVDVQKPSGSAPVKVALLIAGLKHCSRSASDDSSLRVGRRQSP